MVEASLRFGDELRRRREAEGLSLAALADRVHYSKSHLSRVEASAKAPSDGLARACDAALGAEGKLFALAERQVTATPHTPARAGESWRLAMRPDGAGELLVTSADGRWQDQLVLAATWPPSAAAPPATVAYEQIFLHLRALGQVSPPGMILPVLIAQSHALRSRAAGDAGSLLLAARFAEYTGWMFQEAGDDRAAAWWTDHAAGLAAAAGDRDLGPYSLIRHALLALYQGDAVTTMAAARSAQEQDCSARVRGLAAQREAQGRALAGDQNGCLRDLDRAAELLAVAAGRDAAIGSWTVADPVASARGWCLTDLGRHAEAAETLKPVLAQIASTAVRSRARHGARLALAYAWAGETDQACAVAGPVIDAMPVVDSATIRSDLRQLRTVLGRRPRRGVVSALLLRLNHALVKGPVLPTPGRGHPSR